MKRFEVNVKGKQKPAWIRSKLPTEKKFKEVRNLLRREGLHTVCEEAFCPNRTECWESGTATFLLMGEYCTRKCAFCDVKTRNPHKALDLEEPTKIAITVEKLGLKYVVLTSVTRDDLADGGASHLSACIKEIKSKTPKTLIEILIPDFRGNHKALKTIADSKPQVIGHNIETTQKLTSSLRDSRASYNQSLQVLKSIKKLNPRIYTKSSLILGFGESDEGILKALSDLKEANVDIVTLGQYLQPSRKNIPVHEYITPEKFEFWSEKAREIGFLAVVSGPLVRSSYKAGLIYSQIHKNY